MPRIDMMVVSTNVLIRGGIQQVVAKSESPIEVVGAFPDFKAAERHLSEHRVHALLIDDSLPRFTNLGREIQHLISMSPSLAVIVILDRPTAGLIDRLLHQGTRGILHKNDDLERGLIHAILLARSGGIYLSPGISREHNRHISKAGNFPERYYDVLQLTADGFEVKEIAAQLGFSDKTVYRIQAHLRERLNAQNNAHLIDIAHQLKLLESGEA